MNKVDLTLALIILVGAFSGFRDGFRVELFSVLAIFLGVLFGFKFMGATMVMLEKEFFIDQNALPYIAFGAVFFIILFIVNLIARMIIDKYPNPIFGFADPFAAGFLGLLRTAFMMSMVLWIIESLKIEFPPEWTEGSWVWPIVAHFAPDTLRAVGNAIPFFEGVI